MSDFVHLHCHSEYSLLEGALRIPALLKACAEQGMTSVALTDNGNMYGAIAFYLKAKEKGINPILGCDLFVVPDIAEKTRPLQRIVLLCKNYEGYQSLIKLVSIANLDGFYYRPRIDAHHLKQHTEGLIAISPGYRGIVADHLSTNNEEAAKEVAAQFKAIYGPDFYLGIQKTEQPMEDIINDTCKAIGQELDIPLVVTNDVYYLKQDDSYLKQVLRCIQTGKSLEDNVQLKLESAEHYLKSADDMAALFEDFPDALANTKVIADQCHVEIVTDQVLLPNFECPDNKTPEAYLEELVWQGIAKKYGEKTPDIIDRVRFELTIINKMQYARYFLIIYDFLDYCVKESIPVGPGRGSAAGSLVAYALNITKIDPLKYHLLFERFLNPERVSMPDIDIDFCIKRRQEVIDYLVKKYGDERVSQIITFGTMASRGVIRDVGRALNVPLSDVDRIAKLIPSAPGQYTSIPEALEQVPDLKKSYDASEEIRDLIDVGIQLEGASRHTSTHAAGVVISRDPLTNVVPLVRNDGQVSTQYAMADLEKLGLLKMDILGLRNLTVLQRALELINENHGVAIDLDQLDPTDKATYDLLCTGDTIGVFQLESRGMRQLIKDLQPRVFEDIIALLALYRPGPLGSGMVQEFISNKSGKTDVKYDLPEMEPILKDTYGMIVYQEQVMQIASTIGGFSLGQADMLRRAMGKKKKDVMDQMKDEFLNGADTQGFPVKKANKIFDLCYKFAEYGFNKSHSAAYALISYQTAYLKANYPVEYMAALLSSVLGNSDKVSLYISECNQMGIPVLPPSVNESREDFTIVTHTVEGESKICIRFGLGAIKNVGEGAIETIVSNRKTGPYTSLMDLLTRIDLKQSNKRVIESLIKCGGLDDIQDRSSLLSVYEMTLEQAQVLAKEKSIGQSSLFATEEQPMGLMPEPAQGVAFEMSHQDKLKLEKEMLGLYISGHPLEDYQDKLSKLNHSISNLTPEHHNQDVVVGGLLTECRKIITRSKKEMLLGTIEDLKGSMPILMFSNDRFEEYADIFQDDNIVIVKGKVRVNQDEVSLSADDITLIEKSHLNKELFIDLESIDDPVVFQEIKAITLNYKGSMPVHFIVGDTKIKTHRKYWIEENPLCVAQIENLVGSGHIYLK